MNAREVDRDGHKLLVFFHSLFEHKANTLKHIKIQLADKAVFLEKGYEASGWDNLAVGLLPSHQCLRTRNGFRIGAVFSLIKVNKFAVVQTVDHVGNKLGVLKLTFEHRVVINGDAQREVALDRFLGDRCLIHHRGNKHTAVAYLIHSRTKEKGKLSFLYGVIRAFERCLDLLNALAIHKPREAICKQVSANLVRLHIAAGDLGNAAQQLIALIKAVKSVERAERNYFKGYHCAAFVLGDYVQRLPRMAFKAALCVKPGKLVNIYKLKEAFFFLFKLSKSAHDPINNYG